MSFTCPACLWTSQDLDDGANKYCGHCHEFMDAGFDPTDFQKAVIHALKMPPPLDAVSAAELVVAANRLAGASWDAMLLELVPLWGPQRMPTTYYVALKVICASVGEMSKVVYDEIVE